MKLLSKLKKSSILVHVLSVFLSTRIAIFLLALLFMGFADPGRNINLSEAFSTWDGQWYLKVAKEGYHWSGPAVQANVAFFPLYPLAAKILGLLIGNLELSFVTLSHISFFVFLVFLYKIARKYYDDDLTRRAIWYIAIFPLSFVFSIIYNESLFLMLVAGAFYAAYRKKWTLAIILSIFSTLTRLTGLVMLPTLLFYYFSSNKKYRVSIILQILTIPSGVLLFSTYLWFKVGDFFAYLNVLSAWRIIYQSPINTILSTFALLRSIPKYNYFSAIGVFDLTVFTFFTILLILSYKRLPKELFLFSFLIYLTYIFKSWDPGFFYPMGSTNRYLFEAFPLFLTLANFGKNKFFDTAYVTFSLLFLGVLSLAFFSGKWVF